MGVPIALFGTAMYLTMLALSFLRLELPDMLLLLSTAALAITGAGTLYSGWLTWLEVFEIEAVCQWCVASAAITTLLFLVEIAIFNRLWTSVTDDPAE
jgi:uncharacterized membrane protein